MKGGNKLRPTARKIVAEVANLNEVPITAGHVVEKPFPELNFIRTIFVCGDGDVAVELKGFDLEKEISSLVWETDHSDVAFETSEGVVV